MKIGSSEKISFTEGWTPGQGNEAESGAGPQGMQLHRHAVIVVSLNSEDSYAE